MKYITRLQSEILNEVRQAKTKEEKLELLRENRSETLLQLFKYAYGSIESPYRTGVPEYSPDDSPYGYSYSTLQKEMSRLPYFFNTKLLISDENFRNKKLKNILEVLHFSEAALLENVFTKKLDDTYSISKELILEAFPELQSDIG